MPTLTFGRVIGGAAVLVLVSAGGAYAANEWTGANIVNGSLTSADIATDSIIGGDITNGTIAAVDIATDAVTTAKIANNHL